MTTSKLLAVTPLEVLPVDTYLRMQTNLITGEISNGDQFMVAFGPDPADPAIYIHLPDAVLKFSISRLVENGFRALAAPDNDPWTPLERDPGHDRDGGLYYINSIYEVLVDNTQPGAKTFTYRRRDDQPIAIPEHWRRMVDELASPEWSAFHMLASPDDTQFRIIAAEPEDTDGR
jgi:hypothetical protein